MHRLGVHLGVLLHGAKLNQLNVTTATSESQNHLNCAQAASKKLNQLNVNPADSGIPNLLSATAANREKQDPLNVTPVAPVAAANSGPQNSLNASATNCDVYSFLKRLEHIAVVCQYDNAREMLNDFAVKALNTQDDRKPLALKGSDEQAIRQISNLARQRQRQMNNCSDHDRAYAIFSKALERKFDTMSSLEAKRLLPGINRKLDGDNLRAAFVPESGEIWLGSRRSEDQPYFLSTILKRAPVSDP